MRNIHFATYGHGGQRYDNAKQRILGEAKTFGEFNKVTGYGFENLTPAFCEAYKDVLLLPRGAGYWIWKFNILEQELSQLDDGDYVVYADAGCTINSTEGSKKRFREYLKILDDSPYGVLNFQTNHKECSWTIKQIFDYFNVDINSNIATTGQYMATVFVVQKNAHSLRWLDTILKTLVHDMYLFTDKYNPNQPHPLFKDNRHDQSLISIVSKVQGSVRLSDETFDGQNWHSNKAKQWPFWSTRYK